MSTAVGETRSAAVPKLALRPLPVPGLASPPVSPHMPMSADWKARGRERQSIRAIFPSASNSSSPREPVSEASSSISTTSTATPEGTPLCSPAVAPVESPVKRSSTKQMDAPSRPFRPTHIRQRSRSGYDKETSHVSIVSGHAGILNTQAAAPDPNAEQRQKLLNELLTTEEEYLADLQYIVKNYITELEKREIIAKDAIAKIFSNIPQLAEMHGLLLSEMKARPQAIWEPFLKLHPFFKMYTQYCTNYVSVVDYVVELQQSNPAFAAFLNIVKGSTDKRLSLADYLIKPIQRLCKYPLFFRELRGLVPSGTPEHQRLIEADALMGCAAAAVNESKKKTEVAQRLLHLTARIDLNGKIEELIAPDRELLFEGNAEVKINADSASSYMTFLFSDIVLLCKSGGVLSRKKFEVEHVIPLSKSCSVKDVPAESKDRIAVVLLDSAAGYLFETEKTSDLPRLLTAAVGRCAQRRSTTAQMSPREKRDKKEKKESRRDLKEDVKKDPPKDEKPPKEEKSAKEKEKDEKANKEKEERNRKAALVRSISLRGAVKLPFATQDS